MAGLHRGWIAALTAALLASGATAQQKPLTKLTEPVPKVLEKTTKVTRTLDSVTGKALSPPAKRLTTDVTRSLDKTISAGSALLKAPLGSTDAGVSAVLKPSATAPRSQTANRGFDTIYPSPAAGTSASTLSSVRLLRLQSLVRDHPQRLDSDDLGQPIVRRRLLLLDPPDRTVERARQAGFQVAERFDDPGLGLRLVALAVPATLSTKDGLRQLKRIDPSVEADYDHIYEPAGGALGESAGRSARSSGGGGLLIGMIDGGVARHASLAGRIAEQRPFAGSLKPTAHGTAVASLLVGKEGKFRGAASGARLLVADVYGGRKEAGSATAIARALAWLASKRPAVINISLVGPPNALVRRTIEILRGRGIGIVAAVGNDGPAAPPQYPASYPGVISVTGVDARGVALFESGNAADLDFAAPGAQMAAARPGGGYSRVRGTSFAAPLAAGRLALIGSPERLAREAKPGKGRVGQGIVCWACRVPPAAVSAR